MTKADKNSFKKLVNFTRLPWEFPVIFILTKEKS